MPAVRDDGAVGGVVTVRQAGRLLGIGCHLLFRAAETGDLAIYDPGGWARCRLSDVKRWLERQRRLPRGVARGSFVTERRRAGRRARRMAGRREGRIPASSALSS